MAAAQRSRWCGGTDEGNMPLALPREGQGGREGQRQRAREQDWEGGRDGLPLE